MFEATLSQVKTLKNLVESIKELVNEVNIEATSSGKHNLILRTLNSSYG
jgi:DNA polymerase III sliding clamp (beta) subunit (PCNA family)